MKTKPILLNAEQHDQLKHQLSQVLEKEYHIVNQSPGKLEYLSSVLMGFSNHQQRQAAIKKITSCDTFGSGKSTSGLSILGLFSPNHSASDSCNKSPSGVTPQWFGIRLKEDDTSLPKNATDSLLDRGWYELNNDGQYQDFEIEFTYREQTSVDERRSLNLQMSLDFEDKSIRFCLGYNTGDGFNEELWFTLNSQSTAPDLDTISTRLLNTVEKNAPLEDLGVFGTPVIKGEFCSALNNTDTAKDFFNELIWLVNWLKQN